MIALLKRLVLRAIGAEVEDNTRDSTCDGASPVFHHNTIDNTNDGALPMFHHNTRAKEEEEKEKKKKKLSIILIRR